MKIIFDHYKSLKKTQNIKSRVESGKNLRPKSCKIKTHQHVSEQETIHIHVPRVRTPASLSSAVKADCAGCRRGTGKWESTSPMRQTTLQGISIRRLNILQKLCLRLTLQSCTRQSKVPLSETFFSEVWLLSSLVGCLWAKVRLVLWKRDLGPLGNTGHPAFFLLNWK